MTLVLADEDTLVIGHLGDTRACLVRDGVVTLTRDDTLRAELVAAGVMGEARSWASSHQHVLTKAIGMFPQVEPRITVVPMTQGDRMMLLSNGAYRSPVGTRKLWGLVKDQSSAAAAETLVETATASGEDDDITAVIIDVEGPLPKTREGLDRLQAHPLFADLPLPLLVHLRNIALGITLTEPTALIQKGERVSTLYVVVSGALELVDGERRSTFGAGSILGYSRLLWTAAARGDVATEGRVELLAVSQNDFRALALRRPWAGLRTVFEISEYLVDHPDPL